ncbi:VOC family protein [Quadrisphaera sp. DSM 44207]|uniref:VOC family protein n=1 Tax=Quadrisphaera sp. DSM 44207 TaxID=1881057 RepID=UPI000889E777|nr:hypothetical protein [Quadrisphaera sp. DSM 44207]SDQ50355.1 hypothetical protein SAMN05428996_1958 [Quadrisphaera sp. DSM 44207]
MPRTIFVDLPVEDLDASRAFSTALGSSVDPRCSDDSAACVVVDETICVMLLTRARSSDSITGEVGDPGATEVISALSASSREEVGDLLARALGADGQPWRPVMDEDSVYGASVQEPDGHVWEFFVMGAPVMEAPAT